MLDPISNQIAARAARRVANESARKKVREAREAEGAGRDTDSFDSELDAVEAGEAVRRLADADQEDAREDRVASNTRPAREPGREHGGGLDLSA